MLPTDYIIRHNKSASPNLSARVVLSSDGGIGQLIRSKKHDT